MPEKRSASRRTRSAGCPSHGLEQKMGGLGEIREYRPDRHREGAGGGHDRRRLPFRIQRPVLKLLPRIEAPAHRIHAFGPVLVQNEFAEPGMTLESQPEQILDFAFVPVDRRAMHQATDGGHRRDARVELELDVHPWRIGVLVEHVDERPARSRPLFDDQRSERKNEIPTKPLADFDQVIERALEPANPRGMIERGDNPSFPQASAELGKISRPGAVFTKAIEHCHRLA